MKLKIKQKRSLRAAAIIGDIGAIRLLLDAGADGTDPAIMLDAVRYGQVGVIRVLLISGADGTDQATLRLAVSYGRADIVRLLLAAGADAKDPVALRVAAQYGHGDIVRTLLDAGADGANQDARRWAARNGHVDIVKLLGEKMQSAENKIEEIEKIIADYRRATGRVRLDEPTPECAEKIAAGIARNVVASIAAVAK